MTRVFVLRLLGRRFAADRWVALTVSLLVAATTLTALAVVRVRERAARDDLRATVTATAVGTRDLVGSTAVQPVPTGPAGSPAAPYAALLDQVRRGPATALSGLVGSPDWALHSARMTAVDGPAADLPVERFTLRLGSGWVDRVRVTAGRLPSSATPAVRDPDVFEQISAPRVPARVEVALSTRAAGTARLEVGDELTFGSTSITRPSLRVVLVGLWQPHDPADPFWADDPTVLQPDYVISESAGPVVTGVMLAADEALPVLAQELSEAGTVLTVRLPVDPVAAAGADPRALIRALRRASAQPVQITGQQPGGAPTLIRLDTGLDSLLVTHLGRRRPIDALIGVMQVILLAVAGVVLLQASTLLAERRRASEVLAAARGASAVQSLALLAIEGLALGVPGALAGAGLAQLVPGRAGAAGWLIPLLAAVAPAVCAAGVGATALPGRPLPRPTRIRPRSATGRRAGTRAGTWAGTGPRVRAGARRWAGPAGLRGVRPDPGGGGRQAGSRGYAGPALLVALAAVAALALHQRGLDVAAVAPDVNADPDTDPVSGAVSADLLVVLAPPLVAAALALLMGRAMAAPLLVLARRTTRRPGAVAFLGMTRATRRGGGSLTLLAIALALALAQLTAATDATVRSATEVAADQAAAADLRVVGFGLTDQDAARLGRLPGVLAVARLATVEDVAIVGARSGEVRGVLLAGDPVLLARAQAGLTHARGLSPDTAQLLAPAPGQQALPALASADLAPVGSTLTARVLGRTVPLRVVAGTERLAGAPATRPWLLVDLDTLQRRTGLLLAAQSLLASTERGAAPADRDVLAATAPGGLAVQTPAALAGRATSSPLASTVRSALPVALGVGTGYAAVAVTFSLLLGARERTHSLAMLRALGLSARQSAALIAFEVLPAVLAALVAGVSGGLAMTWLIVPATDLRPLTGAVLPAATVSPAATMTGVALAFVAVVAVAVVAAAVAGRAASPAAAARVSEVG